MSRVFDADVLVAGLGPVGAALSALLADEGLSTIAIDRDVRLYPLPRAAHFDHEIMRLFQQLGVADAVGRHARVAPAYEFRNAAGEILMRFELDRAASRSGWSPSYMFHQPGLETALRERLAASPRVETRLGCALTGLDQDAEGVTVRLDGPDGPGQARVRYLVGCDGASSAVRQALGAGLFDYQFDEPWLVIDVLVGETEGLPKVNLQICDPARPTTCVLMGPGRHRWEFMLLPGETPDQAGADAFVRRLLRPWIDPDLVTIERTAVYRFHGLVADRWRIGRALLAGDAAHQTPPFAGQGMCAGLRDAANLAWKLDYALGHPGAETLLETYDTERIPQAAAVIEVATELGRVICIPDLEEARTRDEQMAPLVPPGGSTPAPPMPGISGGILTDTALAGELFIQATVRTRGMEGLFDDVVGTGWHLVTSGQPIELDRELSAWFESVGGRCIAIGTTVEDIEGRYSRWFADHGVAAVLERPDFAIYGTAATDRDVASLVTQLRDHLEAPQPSPVAS